MINYYFFNIFQFLITMFLLFSSIMVTAREISGQVRADSEVQLTGAQVHLMKNNWSDEIIRSASLDDTGNFTIE